MNFACKAITSFIFCCKAIHQPISRPGIFKSNSNLLAKSSRGLESSGFAANSCKLQYASSESSPTGDTTAHSDPTSNPSLSIANGASTWFPSGSNALPLTSKSPTFSFVPGANARASPP